MMDGNVPDTNTSSADDAARLALAEAQRRAQEHVCPICYRAYYGRWHRCPVWRVVR